jgi:ribosomal protein S21
MVYVKKKEGETSDALFRRFVRKVQKSGVLNEARKGRFYKKKLNRNKRREDAIRRKGIRENIEFLKKMGRWEEEYKRR